MIIFIFLATTTSLKSVFYHNTFTELAINRLRKISDDIQIVQDNKGTVDHPINQFKIIQRYVEEWPAVIKEVQNVSKNIEIPALEGNPTEKDLQGTIAGIIRLQVNFNIFQNF